MLNYMETYRSKDKKPCDNKLNAKIVGFSSNRESTLALQDAIFDNDAVSMLTGNDLVEGVKVIDYNEVKETTSSKFTLSKTPKGAITSVYKLNADGTNGTEYTLGDPTTNPEEYSVNAGELTFDSATPNGTKFRVYYEVETATDAKTIKVTSDAFGGSFRIVLDVLVVDQHTKKAYQGQLRVNNGKFEDNFSLDFSAEGDPAVLDLNIEILKDPTSTDMWELVVYDDETVA